ncbi:hypothetical protein ACIHCV_39750 [Streptomyces sp. NPDC051956]
MSEPYSIDDKVACRAPFGDHGLLVMLVNPLTSGSRLSFTWTG